MPIEIRELHIKGVLGDANEAESGVESSSAVMSEEDREVLIALCVERVLEALDRNKER